MKKKILIVDDDKTLNSINERIIISSGIASELHIALNGKEALDYLTLRIAREYALPDIIILDLNMPVMDGFAFMDAFQELNFPGKSKIEIIVFTGSGSFSDQERMSAKGVKYYLNKPYLLRGLRDVIQRINTGQDSVMY